MKNIDGLIELAIALFCSKKKMKCLQEVSKYWKDKAMEYSQCSDDAPETDLQGLLDYSCGPEDLGTSRSWSPKKRKRKI